MDGCRWMHMGEYGCTSVEEKGKEVWWGKRGEDACAYIGGNQQQKHEKH